MKLYYDPISTTSRPVMMFAAEHGLALELQQVSLLAGEHQRPRFLALNANGCVPVLVEGDFVLTESSAILKYLADRAGSRTYPVDLRARARVNAAMDWFATNFHAAVGYQLAYPILFRDISPLCDDALEQVTSHGASLAHRWLDVLDRRMIGPDHDYVAGPQLTLADYSGASVTMLAEAVGLDFSLYPNVRRWMRRMKARPGWAASYAAFNALVGRVGAANIPALAA